MLKRLPSRIFHKVVLRFLLDWQIFKYIPRGLRAKKFLMSQGIGIDRFVESIPHGVDQQVFFHEPGELSRQYVLTPARLVKDKGIDTLLRAFKKVREAGINVNLVIQGDGPDAASYELLSSELGLNDVVQFNKNRVPHDVMRKLYSNASLTVIASRRDFMLFSVMESLACKTPVLISDAIDIAEEVREYGGGEVFACDDHKMLSSRMIEFFNNHDTALAMKEGAARVSERYTNRTVAQKFIALFHLSEAGDSNALGRRF
jgi:glycosyltransferase involved in cell wall biosynthesis